MKMRMAATAASLFLFSCVLNAQSITSGDIAGSVTDPSGASIPDATVTIKNNGTGATNTATTNGTGGYRFSLLPPGTYMLSVTQSGFGTQQRQVQARIGTTTQADFTLQLSQSSQTVTVTESGSSIQTQNGDITTTISAQQLANLPNPGGDLSYIAQIAPGTVMNTQAGYGNFSSFGLPATSNLFTYNGQYDNDPFLNLNNSGATNLLLGQNDVAEVSVVNNGYSGQYGSLAGSQVNYVSKSGQNQFHGNALYYWNGRVMNANDWFNNAGGAPRPFDNVNQWAAGLGGPIVKNHTFFFWDYEGLRVVLPTSNPATIPSPQFEQATIANLTATGLSASVPFYQNMFNLYNGAKGANTATPTEGGGCNNFSGLPAAVPCTLTFRATAGNFTSEYLTSLRIDQTLGSNDRLFGRVQTDHGTQATYTDPINPLFNATSVQPEYQGQLSETHTFGSRAVNQLVFSGQWYSAIFGNLNPTATQAAFPTNLYFNDGSLTTLGGENFLWPQGRNVQQWQAVDDFSWTLGNHTIKFGVNWRRSDVTDFDYGQYSTGYLAVQSLQDFYNGGASGSFLQQSFPTKLLQPIFLWNLGAYVQDEFKIGRALKITAALRIDHNANPQCDTNCFARLTDPWNSLTHDANVPYNQVIKTGLHEAYPATDSIVWQPRIGFAWSPLSSDKTVFRGGIGIFTDTFPATVVDNFSENSPLENTFTVGNAPISPAETNNLFAIASGANSSFLNAFNQGGTLASISASNPYFVPPGFTSSDASIRQPRYYEWNFELQQALPSQLILDINYVGNHGIYEAIQNNSVNAFCALDTCTSGFLGLPASAPDPRFGTVNALQSSATSRYNGVVVRLSRAFSRGLLFSANYTWSHAQDVVSNGGFLPFSYATNESEIYAQNPYRLSNSYGDADYDVRHYFSANYVWDDALRHIFSWGPNAIFSGWTLSGTIFARSGLPFTAVDSAAYDTLASDNFGGVLYAVPLGNVTSSCGKGAAGPQGVPCVDPNLFEPSTTSPTGFSALGKNTFRGPMYFDTDFTVMKSFVIPKWESGKLAVGLQFYNLFNHPNFDQPVNDIANTNPTNGFGDITHTVNTPTSILGSFLGGDASPRLIQLKAQLTF